MTLGDAHIAEVLAFLQQRVRAELRGAEQADQEDVVGEAVVYVLKHRDRYDRQRATAEGWLTMVARQHVREHRKRIKQERIMVPLAEEHLDVPALAEAEAERYDLTQGWEKLDEHERVLFKECVHEGQGVELVGETLGLPRRTAYAKLRRAIDKMKGGLA